MEANSILTKKEFLINSVKCFRPIDIVVIFSSITALYLFRLQDGHQLNPIWQLKQSSNNQHLIQAQPLITDIDGNGLKELIIASEDKIEIFSYHANEFDENSREDFGSEDDTKHEVLTHLHLKDELRYEEIIGKDKLDSIYPVAMKTGCSGNTVPHKELCTQNTLAIVWSDWTVVLLSDQLNLLWKTKPMKIAFPSKLQITEMSILVANGNNTVFGENGLVIVGGVLNLKENKMNDLPRHDHSRPTVSIEMPDEISKARAGVGPNSKSQGLPHDLDPILTKYVGHFTTYALDGKTGEIIWKHEPGDFEAQEEHEEEKNSNLHFKLRLKKKRFHYGEVHWKKYSNSFLKHLPYTWKHYTDSDITLGNFQRSSASEPLKQKNDLIPKQFLAFSTRTDIQSEIKEDNSNVVVLRHQHAIEVLNLNNGRPVCVLPLDGTKRSSVGDVNGDEMVDNVKMYIYQETSMPTCFIVASDVSIRSSVHFNSSVCHPSSLFSYFDDVDTSVHQDIKLDSLSPLLVQPVERSAGISHHILGYGLSRLPNGLDSFVLLSSGKFTAFQSSGRFLWQVDVGFTWFHENNFLPSMKAISLNSEENEDAVIILGPREIMVISLVDGSILSKHSLPCTSTQPLISGDINNDISDEYLVRCSDRYLGFSLERYNRIGLTLLLYSGIASLVGFLLFVIKFIEKEDFPFDTVGNIVQGMRLFPTQGITH